mgnify:CR=1 FL=1
MSHGRRPQPSSDAAAYDFARLATEPFVLLTTFRRSGAPVPTPVWAVAHDGALAISTPAGAGKLKRLRHTSAVTVQACSRRGTPVPGAPVLRGTAQPVPDAQARRAVEQALARKYGVEWKLAMAVEGLVSRVKTRKAPRPRVALLIHPARD